MGDLEIQIRRSTKSNDNYKKAENIPSTPVKTSAVTYQNGGDQGKKIVTEEKPSTSPPYWDYSISNGKKKRGIFYFLIHHRN
jgi:hypothetical protein